MKARRPHTRSPLRLTAGVTAAVTIALMIAGVSMAIFNEHQVRSQKVRETVVQAEILASSVAGALAFDDRNTAQEYVTAMHANREAEAVGVYDGEGRLVAGFSKERVTLPSASRELTPPYFAGEDLIVTV